VSFDAGSAKAKIILDDTQYKKGAKSIGATNQKLMKSFGLMQIGIAAVATAMVVGLTKSIKKADEFNKAFSNVRTLLDEGVVDSKKMQKELLNLDARLGSSIELTKGLYQALSASVEPAMAVQFVGEAAKFAKAGLVDTFNAVDVLTTVLNAYGRSAKDVTAVSDVLFQTIKKGKITGAELASSLGKVIPIAATLGASVEELGAAVATMTKQGINSFETMTQLKALFVAFIKPSQEMQKAIEDFGFSSGSALIEAKGLTGALELLEVATQGNKEELSKLLPNQRALMAALALTGAQAKNYTDALETMNNAAGSTQEAFEKQELTFETLGNQVEKLQIAIGQAFLPMLYELAQAMGVIVEASRIVGPALAIIFDIIGGFVKDIGTAFIDTIKSIASPFMELSSSLKINIPILEAFAAIFEVIKINVAFTIKGLELIIMPFKNLVLVAIEAVKALTQFSKILLNPSKWKEVGGIIKDLGAGIKDIATDSLTDIKDIVKEYVGGYTNLVNTSKEQAAKWKAIWKDASEDVTDGIGDSVDDLLNGLDTAGKKAKKTFKEIAAQNLGIAQGILGQAGGMVSDIFGMVETTLQNQLEVLKDTNTQELQDLEETKDEKLTQSEEEFQVKRDQLEEDREAGLISQEEFDNQMTELDKAQANEKVLIEKDMDKKIQNQKDENRKKENQKQQEVFNAQKANQIASVWIQAATGIVGAWASAAQWPGPSIVAGMALAGVMTGLITALAIANTAVIASQQFVSARKKGGMAGGLTRVNEGNRGEIITLPDNSQVIPNDISRQIAAGVGMVGNTFNVSFAGATISDKMSLRKVSDWVSRDIAKQVRLAT
jgi:TP901 family phage tail tape measure protein